jgi:hypothetical protein
MADQAADCKPRVPRDDGRMRLPRDDGSTRLPRHNGVAYRTSKGLGYRPNAGCDFPTRSAGIVLLDTLGNLRTAVGSQARHLGSPKARCAIRLAMRRQEGGG